MAAVEATDCAIEGTVICASRAEGLVARAGAPAWTTGIGRGASGRMAAGAWAAGLLLEALDCAAALVFAGAGAALAVGVWTDNGFFAAGFVAAVFVALAACLLVFFAAGFAAGLAVFFGTALAAGLAFAAGFTGDLAAFLAGAGLALAAALAVLAAALG